MRSTRGAGLLGGVYRELADRSGDGEVGTSYRELRKAFAMYLSNAARAGTMVVVIDALDWLRVAA